MNRGKADVDGRGRANRAHRSCRGIGDGMQTKGPDATREAPAVIGQTINRRLVRARPGRPGWRRGPYY